MVEKCSLTCQVYMLSVNFFRIWRPLIASFLSWNEQRSHCGGQHQSPINIESNKGFLANYPEFIFHQYDRVFPEILKNDGHTVELKIEEQGEELPFITGGGLGDRYNFVQLHFRWGESVRGSEHIINGKQYPAEMHIVHYNSKYGNFNDALTQADGLSVLGVLIELQPWDNIAFRHLEQFDNIVNPSTTNTDALQFSVPLSELLPDNTSSFFRYNGQLTTGNCNEDVTWTIFDTPFAISERQLAKFRLLLIDDNGNRLRQKVRPTQLLHERVVMYPLPRYCPLLPRYDRFIRTEFQSNKSICLYSQRFQMYFNQIKQSCKSVDCTVLTPIRLSAPQLLFL
ncbi:LOW QUALITY PROTEIN: alpha-carbonic anhydrase [Daphnia pulex]|uniref:Carbonic anhydrase n=1 Tax=Daphnia pulex TaxID=6669 RepID=E9GSS6_DAPPU|nr:LOW QUALITY PROTEIN: alpha-carbonic anhydrase [Daphnia pulex]|eukprot:EFX77528.1 LOW QUALITY PROTEIN: alpha-carbonic anhydrase [Daphnia pulex]